MGHSFITKEGYDKRWLETQRTKIESIIAISHEPVLKILGKNKENLVLMELGDNNKYIPTEEVVKAKKVGEYEYRERTDLFPFIIKYEKQGLKLNLTEYHTKLVKYLNPDLDFDACSVDVYHFWDFTNISGDLYKLE